MKHLLCYILFLLVSVTAFAEVIECTPGQLRAIVGESKDISSLTVKGEMDVTDFDFIAEQMQGLKSLTIDANIAPYKGPATSNGSGISSEGTVPAFALFGSKIKNLTIGDNISVIGEAAFAGTDIETLIIGSGVKSIPESMAKGAKDLRLLSLPESVEVIGAGAFEGCTALQTVDAPGVAVIERDAFNGCSSLTEFAFSPSLKMIGENAFATTALSVLNFSEYTSLESIGARAFAGCENLADVTLPDHLTTLPEGLFFGDRRVASITLPKALTDIETLSLAGLTALNMPENENVIAATALERVGDYALANWKSAENILFPETLTYLGSHAMQQWNALASITIPDGMTAVPELGDDVWQNTPQQQITLRVSSSSLANNFATTGQWKEFNVTEVSSSKNILAEESTLRITFNGSELMLSCTEPMNVVRVYDLKGTMLARSTPHENEATMAVAGENPLVLVHVTTESNNIISKKITCK